MFIQLHSMVVFTHLMFTCIAIGLIVYLDFRLFRGRHAPLSAISRTLLAEVKSTVSLALVGLWLTGIALVALNYVEHGPRVFENYKLLAKVVIVFALTVNGIALHYLAFPMLQGGAIIGKMTARTRHPIILMSAMSFAGWTFAAYLGIARHLNYVMKFSTVLGMFALWWSMVAAVSSLVVLGWKRRPNG